MIIKVDLYLGLSLVDYGPTPKVTAVVTLVTDRVVPAASLFPRYMNCTNEKVFQTAINF